jgi:hypothetical protein
MKETIEKYSNGNKARVITIWTDNRFLKPIPQLENRFILSNKLEGKFIVLYSGSIGHSSDLEIILRVAENTSESDIMFVIIGDGTGKSSMQRRAQELGLNNCMFFPWQETKILPFSMASAHIAVVTLPLQSGRRAIPSKVFNYMSVGAPILCISSADSDLAKMVRETDIGRNFEHHQADEIQKFILELFHDKAKHKYYSEKSLNTSTYFTKENASRFLT